jgi:hypothetical protein
VTAKLEATVRDSSASGYPGSNPETGTSATLGNIEYIYGQFVVTSPWHGGSLQWYTAGADAEPLKGGNIVIHMR